MARTVFKTAEVFARRLLGSIPRLSRQPYRKRQFHGILQSCRDGPLFRKSPRDKFAHDRQAYRAAPSGRKTASLHACGPRPFRRIPLVFLGEMRQFGRMRLFAAGELWDGALGVESLEPDFTPEAFIGMLSGRPTLVKVFLLDQRHVVGVRNIYACEALWEARIRPDRPAGALSKPAIRRLHHALVDVLERAIGMRGTTVDDYVDAAGLPGGFQNKLSVYGREGKSCLRCGAKIVRTVLDQRGTWWCRRCQK